MIFHLERLEYLSLIPSILSSAPPVLLLGKNKQKQPICIQIENIKCKIVIKEKSHTLEITNYGN